VIKNPAAFPAPIINVHPSLLPKYKGLNVIERAMEAGESETGCTVHYVNEELDGGEIILQGKVPILPDDDVESLTKAIQRMEYGILPAAIERVKNSLQLNYLDNAKYELQKSNS
jgi:folate-dependent phosphoribosylglycinamide formyltransferase PurN